MTQNALELWPEIIWVAAGAVILIVFAVAIALPHRVGTRPGSRGRRDHEEPATAPEMLPDGYIDSFSKEIEEAGGRLPLVVMIALPGILLWWLIYLIVNWSPQ
jgi:hypothetical protein